MEATVGKHNYKNSIKVLVTAMVGSMVRVVTTVVVSTVLVCLKSPLGSQGPCEIFENSCENIPSLQCICGVLFQGKAIYVKGTCGFSRLPRVALPCPSNSWRYARIFLKGND
jgi:hypothetical protein